MAAMKNKRYTFIIVGLLGIFLMGPIFLRIKPIYNLLSWYLDALSAEYKNTYFEVLANITGTFLAIAGALWVQRKVDRNEEKARAKKAALVVYYDFDLFFNDLVKFAEALEKSDQYIRSVVQEPSQGDWLKSDFIKSRKALPVHIDFNWIHTVADLQDAFNRDDLRLIYKVYGYIDDLAQILSKPENEVEMNDISSTRNLIRSELCDVTVAPRIEIRIRKDIQQIQERLKGFAEL